jgi:hypothetical protein
VLPGAAWQLWFEVVARWVTADTGDGPTTDERERAGLVFQKQLEE